MHASIQAFVAQIREEYPEHFSSGCRVIEYGSLNINGGVRGWFEDPQEYVGIDCQAGPGVDVVSVVHQYDHPTDNFDVVISTETLEHDPFWQQTLEHAYKNLREGGLFVMTCAGPRRPPHNHNDSPTPGYYKNLSVLDVTSRLAEIGEWASVEVYLNRMDLDLHCVGVKK